MSGQVEWPRPCAMCGQMGPYLATTVKRGSATVLLWQMRLCGCQFTSDRFFRWGEGWARHAPGDRDARRCE